MAGHRGGSTINSVRHLAGMNEWMSSVTNSVRRDQPKPQAEVNTGTNAHSTTAGLETELWFSGPLRSPMTISHSSHFSDYVQMSLPEDASTPSTDTEVCRLWLALHDSSRTLGTASTPVPLMGEDPPITHPSVFRK